MSDWTFQLPPSSSSTACRLREPAEYRALSEKSLAEEAAKNIGYAKALRGVTVSGDAKRSAQKIVDATVKKAWDLSWSPVKTLGMNILMIYFGGGSAGIFTVLIISYALLNGITTVLSANSVFRPLQVIDKNNQFLLQKIVYITLSSAITGYIFYHAAQMGLIPTSSGDFLSLIPKKHPSPNVLAFI